MMMIFLSFRMLSLRAARMHYEKFGVLVDDNLIFKNVVTDMQLVGH